MNLVSIISGASGTGKSYSMRNLGNDAVVLNVERKMLPFQPKGITNVPIGSTSKLFEAINRLRDNKDFRVVVLDSFSEFTDLLLAECKNKAKGFDVWSLYNTEVFNLFQALKTLNGKYVFVVGHNEVLVDADGERMVRMKVKGKENEGMIEKNATCVFYSKTVRKTDGDGVEYSFITNTDGFLPAKTPHGMFPFQIGNDLAAITKRYDAFYGVAADKLADSVPASAAPESVAPVLDEEHAGYIARIEQICKAGKESGRIPVIRLDRVRDRWSEIRADIFAANEVCTELMEKYPDL